MARIYTEIRVHHKSLAEKEAYDKKLEEALKKNGYKSKAEWVNDMYRKLVFDKE